MPRTCARITHLLKVIVLHRADTETKTKEKKCQKLSIRVPLVCFFICFFYLLSSSLFLFLLSVLHLHLDATFSTHILSCTHTLCNQQMLFLDSLECANCADARLAISSNLALPTQTHGALQLGSQLEPPPPRCVDRDRCSTDLSRMLVNTSLSQSNSFECS